MTVADIARKLALLRLGSCTTLHGTETVYAAHRSIIENSIAAGIDEANALANADARRPRESRAEWQTEYGDSVGAE